MPRFVLDAWAILALLLAEEPAAARVKELLQQAEEGGVALSISLINLGEVLYRIGRSRGEDEAFETLNELRRLPLAIIPVSEEAVMAAARLKMRYPISYADAFAASTATVLRGTLLTGDPELVQMQGRIPIERLMRH